MSLAQNPLRYLGDVDYEDFYHTLFNHLDASFSCAILNFGHETMAT